MTKIVGEVQKCLLPLFLLGIRQIEMSLWVGG